MKQFGRILFHGGLMVFSAYDEDGKRKYLTASENERFLGAARVMPPEQEAFCRLLFFTGCRISEGLSLGSDSIDDEENVLKIRTLKKRDKSHVRRIPIPCELAKSLRALGTDKTHFWSFSRTTAWRDVKTVMKLSEIVGIQASPKGLRHGFGVRAALAGIPITKISTWMGHSKVETTAIYLDVQDEEDRALMAKTWTPIFRD